MKQNEPFILFIVGQSASGKTTVYRKLKRKFARTPMVVLHDIDESGVPDVGRSHWRLFRVDELLNDAKKRYEKGLSTIVCGLILPHEVISSECYETSLKIRFLMFRISQRQFTVRMRSRLERLNEIEQLKVLQSGNKRLAEVMENQMFNFAFGEIIDTSKLTPTEQYQKAVNYIDAIQVG